uniref:Uncharacterized protein n=1 Tax=Picea sitchensis TaxID=3332 RepID=A9P0V1_PICSI|nr:unknown [Picea sitchensis]
MQNLVCVLMNSCSCRSPGQRFFCSSTMSIPQNFGGWRVEMEFMSELCSF